MCTSVSQILRQSSFRVQAWLASIFMRMRMIVVYGRRHSAVGATAQRHWYDVAAPSERRRSAIRTMSQRHRSDVAAPSGGCRCGMSGRNAVSANLYVHVSTIYILYIYFRTFQQISPGQKLRYNYGITHVYQCGSCYH